MSSEQDIGGIDTKAFFSWSGAQSTKAMYASKGVASVVRDSDTHVLTVTLEDGYPAPDMTAGAPPNGSLFIEISQTQGGTAHVVGCDWTRTSAKVYTISPLDDTHAIVDADIDVFFKSKSRGK